MDPMLRTLTIKEAVEMDNMAEVEFTGRREALGLST